MDYVMSEKFGLDWKQYDVQRMYMLWLFHSEKTRHEKKEADKLNSRAKGKARR